MVDSPLLPPAPPVSRPPDNGDHLDDTEQVDHLDQGMVDIAPKTIWHILPWSGVALIAAKRGVGATTLARTLAVHCASDSVFPPFSMGGTTWPERVLYWLLDPRTERLSADKLRAIFGPPMRGMGELIAVRGMPENDPLREVEGDALPNDASTNAAGALYAREPTLFERQYQAAGGSGNPKLIVLDPLTEFRRFNARRPEPADSIRILRDYAEKYEVCILGILPIGGREVLTDETAYLYRRIYDVESVLLLRDRNGTRTLTIAHRDGTGIGETILTYDIGMGRVEGGDSWHDQMQDAAANRLLAALEAGPCTERELEAKIGGKRAETAQTLRRLVEGGVVERSGDGKRGNPYRYARSSLE